MEDEVKALTGPTVARAAAIIISAAPRGPAEVGVRRHAALNDGPVVVANVAVPLSSARAPVPPSVKEVCPVRPFDGVMVNEARAPDALTFAPSLDEALRAARRLGPGPARRVAPIRARKPDPRPAPRPRPAGREAGPVIGVRTSADIVAARPAPAVVRALVAYATAVC